jgi:hypothetical protein
MNDREALARAAASEAGLPLDLSDRLRGDTFGELLADAIAFAGAAKTSPSQETLDRLDREAIAAEEERREVEARIALLDARAAEIKARQAWRDARLRSLNSRIDALRAEIRERLAERDVRPRARESRPRRRRAGAGSQASRDGPDEPPLDGRLRQPPELVVRLRLEGRTEVQLLADTAEDQARLLHWLATADVVLHLSATVLRLVADLLGEEGGA